MKTNNIESRITALSLTALIMFTILVCCMAPSAKSAYTAAAKPMEFYLHSSDTPVNVAGLQSKYVMNTTKSFMFLTQQDAYTNSFYKPADQPKITVDFYLYPNLAGPVNTSGLWQVSLWVNGSAYKPARFSLYFQETTVGGATLWNETAQDCAVTSPIGAYIDVPVYNYNLSTTLSHNFTAGTTLHVQAEVNTGASADARIWYDSPLYPSKVILPAQDYARAISIKTYSYEQSETTLFRHDWNDSQRIVNIQANVTDPFGIYDIYKVDATITDPSGNAIISNADMTEVSDEPWIGNYAEVYQLDWAYPPNATLGDYNVVVTVIDNNGYYHKIDAGSYSPFKEESVQTFTIGSPANPPQTAWDPLWLLLLLAVIAAVIVAVVVYSFLHRKRNLSQS